MEYVVVKLDDTLSNMKEGVKLCNFTVIFEWDGESSWQHVALHG